MEITIKTLEEVREMRLTVEVDGVPLRPIDLGHEATRVERDALRERVAGRIRDLELVERQRDQANERADRLNERNAELAAELARLTKGHVCVERCRPNSHVAFVGRERVAELERELAEARTALTVAEERESEMDRRRVAAWSQAAAMTAAIREIRAALDSPALPVPAEPTTLQA